jgi:tRNA(Arg) A34 adenosine deaminase TadA
MRDFILNRAVQEAKRSLVQRGKVGAVVFDRRYLLGAGRAHFCGRTRYPAALLHRRWPSSVHAEMAALLDAGPAARGADLLVVRMRDDGSLGMALPCPWCWSYLVFCRVATCHYSDQQGQVVAVKVQARHPLGLQREPRQIG